MGSGKPGAAAAEEEHDDMEIYDQFLMRSGLCKVHDIVFLFLIFLAAIVVWLYVYKLPLPPAVLHALGMDDTVYPGMVQEE